MIGATSTLQSPPCGRNGYGIRLTASSLVQPALHLQLSGTKSVSIKMRTTVRL